MNAKKLIALTLCALMALLMIPAAVFAEEPALLLGAAPATAAAPTGVGPGAVFFLDGTNGKETNDGLTAATAVDTLEGAIELVNKSGAASATIVCCGLTSLGYDTNTILPEHTAEITLTSVYGGTDYRLTGALLESPDKSGVDLIYFNGSFRIEKVTFQMLYTNCIFCLQYNNFYVGEEVTILPVENNTAATAYPILLAGLNGKIDKAESVPTIDKNVTVEVHSGDWQYYRGGDRDTQATFAGTLTTNIYGGVYHQKSSATNYYTNVNNQSCNGKSNYTAESKTILNLYGGEYQSIIAAVYTQPYTPKNENNGSVVVNIYKGVTVTDYFCAIMKNNFLFNGTVTINLYGGDFSSLLEAKLDNQTAEAGGTGKVYINYEENNAEAKKAYDDLIKAAGDTATDVISGTIKGEAPTTDAPTTAAPTTDAPTTTAAPQGGEVTPATGDSLVVIACVALVAALACTVIVKKKVND